MKKMKNNVPCTVEAWFAWVVWSCSVCARDVEDGRKFADLLVPGALCGRGARSVSISAFQ